MNQHGSITARTGVTRRRNSAEPVPRDSFDHFPNARATLTSQPALSNIIPFPSEISFTLEFAAGKANRAKPEGADFTREYPLNPFQASPWPKVDEIFQRLAERAGKFPCSSQQEIVYRRRRRRAIIHGVKDGI